ncbi:MAG: DUF3772 domain-containing protein, partial [Paracoccaceae bacterium]|nr:DUF3772 domain-containing protein [Paracoccaceae bacterium]
DYAAWQETASRAENAIEAGRASNVALEDLRAEVVSWREAFLAAQSSNGNRIGTIRTQIEALGTLPEGATEPDEIAARRSELTEQLARLQAPVLAAEEAFTRANGIISEIDRIIRERQTDALLTLGPSPLNPVLWPQGLQSLLGTLSDLGGEISDAWSTPAQRDATLKDLPVTLVLTVIGLVLVLRGRRWATRLGARFYERWHRGRDVWGFLVSLTQVAIPMMGVYVLAEALFATGLVGIRGAQIVGVLPLWAAIMLGGRWLVGRLFPSRLSEPPLEVQPERRSEARYYGTALAFMIVGQSAVGLLAEVGDVSPESAVVLGFPVLVLTALVLFRLGQFMTAQMALQDAESAATSYRNRLVRLLSSGAKVVAVVAPLAGAVGYFAAA